MKKIEPNELLPDPIFFDQTQSDNFGCEREFNSRNTICKKHCILSLRCAIEKEKYSQMELLEELMASEDILMRVQ